MLETIREYATEQLEQRDDPAAWRLRHAEWCCKLAEREGGMPPYRHLDEGLGALPDEYDNVRAAIAATWASGLDELALRFGPACVRFWMSRGFFSEASSWLERAEPMIDSAALRIRLEALRAAGVIAFLVLADTDRAEELWIRAQALAEDLGENEAITWIERMRAGVAWERGDLEAALSLFTQNLGKARASGNRRREAECLHMLGEVLRDLERFEEGEEMLLLAGAIYRELGLQGAFAGNLHSLADLALDRGDLVKAEHLYRDVLELYALHSGPHGPRDVAYCLAGRASVFVERGLDEVAATLWGAVCAAEETLGFRMISFERRRYESRLGRVENTTPWVAGRRMTIEDAQAFLERHERIRGGA
jgi:tetratricopeptide (TPR) repeat protein